MASWWLQARKRSRRPLVSSVEEKVRESDEGEEENGGSGRGERDGSAREREIEGNGGGAGDRERGCAREMGVGA